MSDQSAVEQVAFAPTTSCNGCKFAEWTENNKQIGCDLGRLDKFKELGVEIVEAMDDTHEFFVVGDRCAAYRKTDWEGDIEKELALEYDVVLLMTPTETEEQAIDLISRSIEEIFLQDHLPRKIVIANTNKYLNKVILAARNTFARLNPLRKGENVLHDTIDVLEDGNAIDEGVKSTKAQGYLVWESGQDIDTHAMKRLSDLMANDLEKICMVRPLDEYVGTTYHGFFVLSFLHRAFDGFSKECLAKQIEERSNIDDKQSLVRDWSMI